MSATLCCNAQWTDGDYEKHLASGLHAEIAALRSEVERWKALHTECAANAADAQESLTKERDEACASLSRVTVERDRLAAATVREGAAAQRAEAECARLREEGEHWQFVADSHGGHMLSVPTGDKWYPETFLREEGAAAEARGFAAGVEAADRVLARLSWGEQSNVRMVVRALRPSPALNKEPAARVVSKDPCAGAPAPAATPEDAALDAFHAHLDACRQCRDQPFNLCPVGLPLFLAAGRMTGTGRSPSTTTKENDT